MKTQDLLRLTAVFAALVAFLVFGAHSVAAGPQPPVPVSPAEGSTIVTPVFAWQASSGSARYELEVGPQSDPNVVYWSAQTVNLTLTPNNANKFTNDPLYWRVRGRDSSDAPGWWSSKVNFTKHIPAPTLVAPADGSYVIDPALEWGVVQGATYYKVELSTSPTFITVEATYTTYNTRITPVSTLAHGTHYWRVSGVDADGHVGTPASRSFTKYIPAPTLVSPSKGHPNVHIPTLVWQPVAGAAYYKVELSTSPTFVPVEATYTTYNTRVTPVNTLAHGTHYWRVSGVDADGHVGTPGGAGWSFVKGTYGPVLVSPDVNAVITIPTLEWAAVDGAAYYKVELSTSDTFVPVVATYTTYNLRITPVDTLTAGAYYWRVSGVDSDGHVGANNWRKFTLNAPPAPTDSTPQLLSPGNAATIDSDPTFSWSRVVGADHYRVVVSTQADFSPTYETVLTDYSSYTPYSAGSFDAYPNGVYYWKVEAKTGSGTVIATSAARSFTKQESLPLIAPDDEVTGLTADPNFEWSQIVGAHHYRLVVSTHADFNPTYETVLTDYNSYTPYSAGSFDAYPNGVYYWRVEAKTSSGTVIATSAARSFTKQEPLPLIVPADGITGLTADPNFQWNQIIGAHHYRLVVSTRADFSPTYETVLTDYNSYTPYSAGSFDAYPNGAYYWKVEARTSSGTVIATSVARSFTKQEPLPLVAPANGVTGLTASPNFQWNQVIGAHHYRLVVSTRADFSPTYETVLTDYNSYTPYSGAGSFDVYPNGVYYWKVEARTSAGTVITTSGAWRFTIGTSQKTHLPLVLGGS
jgi:hypothetical protein